MSVTFTELLELESSLSYNLGDNHVQLLECNSNTLDLSLTMDGKTYHLLFKIDRSSYDGETTVESTVESSSIYIGDDE